MAELKWVRIVTNIFDNPKLIQIDAEANHDEIIVIWFKLLCLAGKCNNDGLLTIAGKPYTEKMLSVAFNRSLESVKKALSIFKDYNMIEETNKVISILNWSKHQSTDKIEKLNERQREYMKKYRLKQKALCNANGNANGEPNVSSAEDRSKKKEERVLKESIEKKTNDVANAPEPSVNIATSKTVRKQKAFIPPTLDEIKAYALERQSNVDPKTFFDYFNASKWVDSEGKPVLNWKQKFITWDTKQKEKENDKNEKGKRPTVLTKIYGERY